jgi:hypothetical protein
MTAMSWPIFWLQRLPWIFNIVVGAGWVRGSDNGEAEKYGLS